MSALAVSRLDAERRFHATLMTELDVAVVAADADTRVTHYNRGAERLYGWRAEQIVGRILRWDRVPISAGELARGATWEGELEFPMPGGETIPTWSRISPLHAPDGTLEGFLSIAVDLTERKHAARQLERRIAQQAAVAELGERALAGAPSEELERIAVQVLAAQLDVHAAVLLHHDPPAGLLRVAASVGLAPADVAAWTIPDDAPRPSAIVRRSGEAIVVDDWAHDDRFGTFEAPPGFDRGSSMLVAVRGRQAAIGVLIAHSLQPRSFGSDDLHFLQSLANVLSTAIERERVERAIRHQALHDRVTGLPNRTLLLDRLGHAIDLGRRRRRDVAVLFLDIDHFKVINDTLGHAAGDELLRQVAPRLRGAVRPSDTVARFGGDEFVLLCEDVDEHQAATIARRVLQAFAPPFVLDGQEHYLSTSVGIALTRDCGNDPDALVRDADTAMYRAKERGRGRYELFDDAMRQRALARMRLEADLRRAAERGELEVHYQPVVSFDTGRAEAVEALVRWRHPQRGLLAAAEFVPVAAECGLLAPITGWVLREALEQVACWRAELPDQPRFCVGVNVSAVEVGRPDFLDGVLEALAAAGVPPEALGLEVTESTLADGGDPVRDTLQRLRDLGCHVTLDDFGTGASPLSHLERFPADVLKIDGSFVARLQDGVEHAPVARALVGVGQALGLIVAAEGVETAEQEAGLRALGCTIAQGYRFGAPAPAASCAALLARPLAVGA